MMEHFTPPDVIEEGFDKNQQAIGAGGGSSMAFDSLDKIQVDFDSGDLEGMEGFLETINDDLDNLSSKEAAAGEDDNHYNTDTVNELTLDQLNLDLNENLSLGDGGSESSMDKLLSMNIIEVDGDKEKAQENSNADGHNSDLMREFAKGFLAQEENGRYHQQQYGNVDDPLLGLMSGGEHEMYEEQRRQQIVLQQQQKLLLEQQQQEFELQQQIEQQQREYELQQQIEQQHQMMKMQVMMQQQQHGMVQEQEEEVLTAAKVSQLASMGSADLEREKMKLLSRLQEINSRQANPMGMMQQAPSQRQSSSGVASASVMNNSNNSGSGETPLSAFLRNKNNSGVATPSQASMLSQNIPGAPAAASIFDAAPMDFGSSTNPFLRHAAGGDNPLMSAINNSTSSQNMIRQTLSGRNLRASGVTLNRRSGTNLMDMMASDLGSGGNQNAVWGSSGISPNRRTGVSSFSSSGILARHVSDGHLLAGATTVSASLAKTKNRVGSLSRENSLYNMLKNKQGSHKALNALGRQSSYSRLSKSGSRGSIARNDSNGSLLPTKRGGGRTGPKYKIGASTSVPHLMVRGRGTPSPTNNPGGNAMW
jgi:hypothetical protein